MRDTLHLRLGQTSSDDGWAVSYGEGGIGDLVCGADRAVTGGGLSDHGPCVHSGGLRGCTDRNLLIRHALYEFLLLCGVPTAHDAQPQLFE